MSEQPLRQPGDERPLRRRSIGCAEQSCVVVGPRSARPVAGEGEHDVRGALRVLGHISRGDIEVLAEGLAPQEWPWPVGAQQRALGSSLTVVVAGKSDSVAGGEE